MKKSRLKILVNIFFLALIPVFSSGQSYLGYVTEKTIMLSGFELGDQVVATPERGTPLFVSSLETEQGFYQVLNISTNDEGYILKEYVKIDRELNENENGVFTPVRKTDSESCLLYINNNTNLELTLKLGESTYRFASKEEKEVSISPGKYNYRVSAANVLPNFGMENFEAGTEYEWEFYVSN